VEIPTFEIAKTCTEIVDGYFQNAKTTFSATSDKRVYAFARLRYIREPHYVQFRWFAPSGLYHESEEVAVSEEGKFHEYASVFQMIEIAEMAKLGLLGAWRVEIRVDGETAAVLPFTIVE
jgi:hypothetical protein